LESRFCLSMKNARKGMELGRIRAWAYGASQICNSLSLAEAGSVKVRPEELGSSAELGRVQVDCSWRGGLHKSSAGPFSGIKG